MIRVANAPCSWGINELLGEARFTWQQVLDEIAATGYTGTELGPYGFLPTDPSELSDALEGRGLTLLSAFVPVGLASASSHERGLRTALEVGELLAAMGAGFIVLADENGSVGELVRTAGRRSGTALSGSEWDVYAEGVDRIARGIYEAHGLKLVFHHHGAGYVETPAEVRALLERTDPARVGLCLDTGHYHFGGGDAVACLREWGPRIPYLHFKDFVPVPGELDYLQAVSAGTFCELGKGEVDFPGVLAELAAYDGWAVVEQDVHSPAPDAPRQSALANREYLRGLGL